MNRSPLPLVDRPALNRFMNPAPFPAAGVRKTMRHLRELAFAGLTRMYRPEERVFAFRLRKTGPGTTALEGVSRRYTAMTLIGLADEEEARVGQVLAGHNLHAVCQRLLSDVETVTNLGDVAVSLWAARAVDDPETQKAFDRLCALKPVEAMHATVELSWTLVALCLLENSAAVAALRKQVAERLLGAFNPQTGVFPHMIGGHVSPLRAHVACFADLVYPIHALSHYYQITKESKAIDAARRCAGLICDTLGQAGQWWWHYDVRTGRVIEGYPVYAVHQDAMAPMALFALQAACGADYSKAIEKGVEWLARSPELNGGSLIDEDEGIIWRKVARREPNKFSRRVQAAASRVHAALRLPGTNLLFPPRAIDYEDRPYHLGWLLYAWPAARMEAGPAADLSFRAQ